jgi:hypothetical protein
MDFKNTKICPYLILLSFLTLLFHCSIKKGLNKYESGKLYNLGKATEYDINQTIPRTLRKYQYQILDQYDTGGYYTIQTDWKHRYPLEDELDKGIIEGKMRLFIRMRKISDNLSYVQLEVENMIKTSEDRYWFNSIPEGKLKEKVERMVEELTREFAESRLRRS